MADTVTLTDTANNPHQFFVHPLGTNYQDLPGVYAVARDEGHGYSILYIGEAESLKRRLGAGLKQHHRYDAITRAGATHLLTRVVNGGLAPREQLETSLRHQYDPPCNRQ